MVVSASPAPERQTAASAASDRMTVLLMRGESAGALLGFRGLGVLAAATERIGNQPPTRGLGRRVPGGKRYGLAPHRIGLRGVAFAEPHAPELDPQQRVVGLDAQRPLEGRRRLTELAAAGLRVRLRDERSRRRAETELTRPLGWRALGRWRLLLPGAGRGRRAPRGRLAGRRRSRWQRRLRTRDDATREAGGVEPRTHQRARGS